MKRDGGVRVELSTPLKIAGKEVGHLDMGHVSLDQMIKWFEYRTPSTLALISDLCGIEEKHLRKLSASPGGDFNKMMTAFVQVAPTPIRKDFEEGKRPLATPADWVAPEPEIKEDEVDPIDNRFPLVEGANVIRSNPPPHFKGGGPRTVEPTSEEEVDDGGIGLAAAIPPSARAVNK
jgi:hypothetical protein